MRILLFIDCLGPGGAQRQIVGLATLLKTAGNDVGLLIYHDILFYKLLSEIKCYIIRDSGNLFKRLLGVRKVIRQFEPDCIISYLDSPSMIVSFWKMLGMKYKLIVSERNTTQHVGWRDRLKFRLYRFADAIVPNSYSQKRFVDVNYPQYREKTIVIPNFVDISYFNPVKKKTRSNSILVVASVWGSKNTLGFIDAARLLKKRGASFVVRWYGIYASTPYVEKCKSRIREYGLEDMFLLLPQTPNIIEAYQTSDYFCLPSFFEGTPNVLCEAMACGLPIICSDVCDNGIYVKEGVDGFLFNPCNTSEIADKMERALQLSDNDYYECCGKSREVAEASFSKLKFIDSYLSLINCISEKTCHQG